MEARQLKDSGWVTGLFGGTTAQRDERFLGLRRYSNAMLSFEDTTMGGSQALNAPPQFTMFADPSSTGAFAQPDAGRGSYSKYVKGQDQRGSYRLGTFYYEAINQNSFYLHCRFGKPRYIGVAAFFANMYDSNLAYLARTGDYPGMLRAMGTYVAAAAIWAAVGTVAFAVILITPRMLKMVLNKQTSRYYYVKPTMHLYLRAVQNMVNTQLVYRRLVPTGVLGTFQLANAVDGSEKGGTANKYNGDRKEWYSMLPEIWTADGEFDIYRMINRYQTLANYQAKTIDKIRKESSNEEDMARRLRNFYLEATYSTTHLEKAAQYEVSLRNLEHVAKAGKGYDAGFENVDNKEDELVAGMNGSIQDAQSQGGKAENFENEGDVQRKKLAERMAQVEKNQAQVAKSQTEANSMDENNLDIGKIENWMDQGQKESVGSVFKDYIDILEGAMDGLTSNIASEIRNGSQWITWRVDGRDTVGRSFSNTTKEPEISGTVNSATQKARSLEVNLSGGKTGFDAVDGLITGLKSAFTGALDFLHLSGIMSLYNSSVIDFPEVWDSSDTSGDDISLSIPLRCWSGNDLDVFQDLIVPLSFWLAAVCPLATGKQSFTHPFYLECYSRGRYSMRNAMVTNLSLQFGTGGLGWRADGLPLSCDIQVTIRDLSRVMYMPIVTDIGVFDDDNKFSEFMSVLGAATLYERTNGIAQAKINASIWAQNWASAWSQGSIVNAALDIIPARQIANIFLPQAR
ncbi:hypothetical protein YQ37_02275 [Salmonella enterica subsp. enterica serovar Enteritidis]|nr:hypothetical protein [Salmonella enterica subsp. enterica serovar Enteritidis]